MPKTPMQFEEALAILITETDGLNFTPVVICVDYEAGGDVQIGDMTWDHDDASLTVIYHSAGDVNSRYEFYINLENYEARRGTGSGFGGLMNDLLAISAENAGG